MYKVFVKVCLLAFIISFACCGVLGCSCFDTHPQTLFCTRDFVFLGEVESVELENEPQPDAKKHIAIKKYRVKLITKMKGISNPVGSIVVIQTPRSSAMCGVSLAVGNQYILSGSNHDGKRVVILCDIIDQEQSLSATQRRFFLGTSSDTYKANCMCKEIVKGEESVSSTNGCKLPRIDALEKCYMKGALCMLHNGSCKWAAAACL